MPLLHKVKQLVLQSGQSVLARARVLVGKYRVVEGPCHHCGMRYAFLISGSSQTATAPDMLANAFRQGGTVPGRAPLLFILCFLLSGRLLLHSSV